MAGGLQIDAASRTVLRDGAEVQLTYSEFRSSTSRPARRAGSSPARS